MPAVRGLRALLVTATVAYVVSVLPGARPVEGYSVLWEVVVYTLVGSCATALCVSRAIGQRTDRVAWALVAAGFGFYTSGALVSGVWLQPQAEIPYPSVADALWLLCYPFTLTGLLVAVRARTMGSSASAGLDGLVAGLGLAALGAIVVFGPALAGADGPPVAVVVNFAYPVLDLALGACTVGAMAGLGAWRDRTLVLLAGSFIALAAGDTWYLAQVAAGTYHPGSFVDATWSVGLCLAGLGASSRPPAAVAAAESRSFLLPAIFTVSSIGVLAVDSVLHVTPLSTALAIGALLAAFARTVQAVREVVALADSRRQARTDALTGLPNRRAMDELLQLTASGDREAGALLLIDLDRFKEVNDALGHRMGDGLLRAAGARLSAELPPTATLSRLGGDEFAVLLPGVDADDAQGVAVALRARLQEPFTVAGMTLHVDASIGVTTTAAGDADRVLARADVAMYRAKASRTGVEVYDGARDGDAWDRLAIVEDLRDALAAGGLHVALQPIVALPGRTPAAVEALLRWTHPVRGPLTPDEFLPMAERAGLMWTVTRYVLAHALDEALTLRRAGWSVPVAVNLSASDLLNSALVDAVAEGLHRRGLPGTALHLEITESLLVEDREVSDAILCRLRALGVRIAVDDFGTGYSSLAYLRDLPVDELKIDRSFVSRLHSDDRTPTIVASTIDLAHGLGLHVVAEGVETAEQLAWLDAHGCDTVQGYLLGRPMAPHALRGWLAAARGAPGTPGAPRAGTLAPAHAQVPAARPASDSRPAQPVEA